MAGPAPRASSLRIARRIDRHFARLVVRSLKSGAKYRHIRRRVKTHCSDFRHCTRTCVHASAEQTRPPARPAPVRPSGRDGIVAGRQGRPAPMCEITRSVTARGLPDSARPGLLGSVPVHPGTFRTFSAPVTQSMRSRLMARAEPIGGGLLLPQEVPDSPRSTRKRCFRTNGIRLTFASFSWLQGTHACAVKAREGARRARGLGSPRK
jgi:hypothetical protein